MKKLLMMVALALTTLNISAQDDSKFTVKAGIGLSSVVGSDADTELALSYKAGLSYDIRITDNFYVVPGVELAFKGFNSDNIDGRVNMAYVQVPIFAAYKFILSDNMKLALKAGPYVSIGAFGSDIEWYGRGTSNVFGGKDGYDRFDVGVIGGASLEISKFMVGLEYSRGLKKLDSNYSQFNQAFGLVLGYRF